MVAPKVKKLHLHIETALCRGTGHTNTAKIALFFSHFTVILEHSLTRTKKM